MNLSGLQNSVCKEKNYEAIYREHSKKVRNFIYYKCGNLNQAEDIVQEAFVKLWENCGSVVFDKAKSFLYTVAQRLFIDHVRHKNVELTFVKNTSLAASTEDPSHLLIGKEFKGELERIIASLPEKQREVFLMNRIDKMSYAEIAGALEISVKAVEKRMHNALLTLKEKVKELNLYKI